MKHEVRIVALLLAMFVVTQLIGLVVIDSYTEKNVMIEGKNVTIGQKLPEFVQPPEMSPMEAIIQILVAFALAIGLFLLLTKFRAETLITVWFTFVVFTTLTISLNGLLYKALPPLSIDFIWIAVILALPLAFYKIFKRNLIVHNMTELMIYPGLAAIFVPLLRPWSIILLLFVISLYDMWAVWKSTFMVNLAKYQIKNLKIFTGFFVPYISQKERDKLKKVTAVKARTVKAMAGGAKDGIKVSLALLGGGDVAFPLIFAGVMLRFGGGLIPALLIILGSTLGLLGLFMYSKKGKFYPAMPFITAGALVGWLAGWLIGLLI